MTPEQKHELAESLAALSSHDWFWYDWEEDVIRGPNAEPITEEMAINELEEKVQCAMIAKAFLDKIGRSLETALDERRKVTELCKKLEADLTTHRPF